MNKIASLLFLILFISKGIAQPTWSGQVANIMYKNCTSCHRTGGIAPFALETYQEVSAMAGWVQQVIENKKMPPWPPDENYKKLVHERVMDQSEITTFADWVSAGIPSGNLNFAPPLPIYSNGSQLGSPNISLSIPNFTVPNNGDYYKNFVLNVGNTSATNAVAIEVLPGNPAIVHHVLVFQDSTNNNINTGGGGGGTGSAASQLVYSWVPGTSPYFTPVGTGIRLAPNTRIILQIHYAPGSNGMNDGTIVNFKTNNSSLRKISVYPLLNNVNLTNGPLSIPAGQIRTFNAEFTLPYKTTFLYTFPHMHLLGKNFRVWANAPVTNDTTRFVWIPEWDFHWQDNFVFPNSVVLNTGNKIKSQAVYDNTSSNSNNPSSPPVNVSFGEGTTDEMHLVFLAYMPYVAGDEFLIIDKRIFPKGATTFCSGHDVLLETIEGLGYTYQWLLNGVLIPNETNYYINASQSGSYTVSITLGPNNVVSDPVGVNVNSLPVAQIQNPPTTVIPAGGNISLSAVSVVGAQYQWYLNGNMIAGASGSTYNATNLGAYTVEVFNGTCFAVSDPITLTGGIAALDYNDQIELQIKPNPVSDELMISGSILTQAELLVVSDLNGKKLIQKSIVATTETKLQVGNLPHGTYFLSVTKTNGEVLSRRKFVVVR